jgi:hypothetical protein
LLLFEGIYLKYHFVSLVSPSFCSFFLFSSYSQKYRYTSIEQLTDLILNYRGHSITSTLFSGVVSLSIYSPHTTPLLQATIDSIMAWIGSLRHQHHRMNEQSPPPPPMTEPTNFMRK